MDVFSVFNVFYLGFVILFSTLFTSTNEYSFRKSSNTLFAFSNAEMPISELEQRGNRLYLEKSEKLKVVCQLVDKTNWNLLRSEELTKKHASTGLQPYITFKNRTWWKTYRFPSRENLSSVHWHLEISREEFMQGPNDVLFEPWFVTMELGYGLGLFETTGILISKEPLLNLSQSLGIQVADNISLMVKSDEFVVKSAPCCSDISFVLPFKNKEVSSVGGCYVGITFGAFAPETILWLDLCSKQGSNHSLCHIFLQMDCDKLRLLDLVVTRNYLIIATSYGLVRSANFRHLVSGKYLDGENYLVISQSANLSFDDSISSGVSSFDIRLQYTSYCMDFHVFNQKKDFFYLLFEKSVYKSVSPFTRLLEISVSNMPLSDLQVLGIANDLTKNTHVLLAQSLHKFHRYIVLAVTHEKSADIIFPPWYFPEGSVATDLYCHTWPSTLFVYGSQVWQSRDGGNSFHQLTELTLKHTITSLSLPQYDNSIVAMTNYGTILQGRVGLPRLVAINHQPFLGPLHMVLMDELQNILGFFRNESGLSNLFGGYFVQIVAFKSYQNHFCGNHVLLQFVSKEDVLIFVSAAPFSHTNQTLRKHCFGSDAVGQVFRSRLGGSAHVAEITHLNSSLGYVTRARGKVIELFTALSSRSVLESNIRLSFIRSGSDEVVYVISVSGGYTGWSSNDEGKTVILSNGMSILLKRYINETTMYGLPSVGISADLLPQGTQEKRTWQLYDLRSGTIVVQRNYAMTISISSEGFEASTTSYFNDTHVGMMLMINSDHFGVIKTVKDAGRTVVLMSNTILKEGNYSGWSLYRPAMNTTELMTNDFNLATGPGMWWIEEESCASFPIVTPRRYKTLYHLDSRDNLSFELSVLTKHQQDGDVPQISMFVDNPSLFRIQSIHLYTDTNYTLKVDLQRKPDTSGLSLISFNTRDTSLNCPRVSNILTIHGGCPPSKRLVFQYPHTFPPEVLIHGSPFDHKGILRSHKLPPNYRPPSSRGIGIPMSSNLYNVFPEKPPYKEMFAISRETRLYKQCRGKSFRQHCDCHGDDMLTISSLVALSDCINTVYRLVFREIFKPKFTVVQEDAVAKPFHDPYYLVELNLRSDYQVLRGTKMSVSEDRTKIILQDSLNSSLEFSGSGLYHFRAYAVKEGYTLCELNDEFIVFVDDMPLPHPAREIVRLATAMAFAGVSFLAYIWFFYLSKKGELNRVFRDT